jgi:hypothetical protein
MSSLPLYFSVTSPRSVPSSPFLSPRRKLSFSTDNYERTKRSTFLNRPCLVSFVWIITTALVTIGLIRVRQGIPYYPLCWVSGTWGCDNDAHIEVFRLPENLVGSSSIGRPTLLSQGAMEGNGGDDGSNMKQLPYYAWSSAVQLATESVTLFLPEYMLGSYASIDATTEEYDDEFYDQEEETSDSSSSSESSDNEASSDFASLGDSSGHKYDDWIDTTTAALASSRKQA